MNTVGKSLIVGLIGAGIAFLLILAGGCGDNPGDSAGHERTLPGDGYLRASGKGMITKNLAYDEWIRAIQQGEEPVPDSPKVSLSEAERNTGIKARIPNDTLGGMVKGVYTDTSASQNPQLSMILDNGVIIIEEATAFAVDYGAMVEATAKEMSAPGRKIIGAIGQRLISIAGNAGYAIPVNTVPGADNKEYELPPQVEWWDNAVRYHITLWKLGLTDQQLIKIAESMY